MPLGHGTSLFRNHPILVATTAASGGVLLGAYVALQLFAAPVQRMPPSGLQPAAEARATKALETSTAAYAAAETTGAAPRQDSITSVDRCEGQTWPNLTRGCMEQMQSQRAERTGATDPTEKTEATRAPQPSGAVASNAAPATSQQPAAPQTQIQSQPQTPQPSQAAAAPAVAPTAVPASAPANPQGEAAQGMPAQDTAASTSSAKDSAAAAKAERRKIREAKRKAKKQRREEFDDRALAYTPNEAGDDEDVRADRYDRRSLRAEGRAERSRRERVVVRGEDDDDSASERDGRRVYVIRRGGEDRGDFGGGIFGGLFGN